MFCLSNVGENTGVIAYISWCLQGLLLRCSHEARKSIICWGLIAHRYKSSKLLTSAIFPKTSYETTTESIMNLNLSLYFIESIFFCLHFDYIITNFHSYDNILRLAFWENHSLNNTELSLVGMECGTVVPMV